MARVEPVLTQTASCTHGARSAVMWIRYLAFFARMEELARQQGKDFPDLSLDEKDELWNAAKEEEKAAR